MWRRFYLNLFNSFDIRKVLIIILLAAPLAAGNAQSSKTVPKGVLGQLQGVIETHRSLLKRQFHSFPQFKATQLKQLERLKLHEAYLRSLILHSPHRFIAVLDTKRSCQIYDFILNDLLKSEPELNDLLVFRNKKQESFTISKELFQEHYFKKNCPNEYSKLQFFSPTTITSFLSSVKFVTPQTNDECTNVFDTWRKNQFVPNLCSLTQLKSKENQLKLRRNKLATTDLDGLRLISKQLDDNSKMIQAVPSLTQSYLKNYCQYIDNKDKFCKLYVSPHIWHKVIMGDRPEYLMSYRCQDFPKSKDLVSCRQKLLNEPRNCHLAGSKYFPALFPKENCNVQSFLLNKSRLVTKYRDCPAYINNGIITNISRIYSHFNPDNENKPQKECSNYALKTFANLNLEYKNESAWPIKVCYFDKIENQKVCKSFVPGASDATNSENNVVANIIQRLRPAPNNLKCKITNTKIYNPNRLSFKSGCYIVFDFINCTLDKCPKRIYLEGKEVKGIEYVGNFDIHYFDDNFVNPKYSQLNILRDRFKIAKRDLLNFTLLKSFFKQRKENIVHGIACLELLLPRFIKSKGFNQCTPEAFILDDILEVDGKKFVIARLAMDDVHSPRMIWWHNIFHATRKYQELHPAKPWTLYGAYQEDKNFK